MFERILVVGQAEAQTAEGGHNLRMHAAQAQPPQGVLPAFHNTVLDLLLGAVNRLLDAAGVDAAVLDEGFQGNARRLAADRIK